MNAIISMVEKQKKRVQKKYTLLLGRYLSPKELREWYKHKGVRKHEKT